MRRESLCGLLLIATALFCVHAGLASCLFAGTHRPIFTDTTIEVALYALAVLIVLRDPVARLLPAEILPRAAGEGDHAQHGGGGHRAPTTIAETSFAETSFAETSVPPTPAQVPTPSPTLRAVPLPRLRQGKTQAASRSALATPDEDGNGRRAVVFILVAAAVFRAMLLFADPVSTDIDRYVWDGRVQGAGINPYAYIPADPALHFLRDDDIYPEINRADYAPTIYPPLAQIVFFLVTRVSESLIAMKAAMVGFEAAAIWAILRLLKARRLPAARVLLYAWHPLPIWEFSGSGHVDAIAVACIMLAILAAETRRPLLAGVALGGAALVKFFPVVIGPALYRRWDWRLPAAGAATVALLYLPYLGAGAKIFGFLGGYSDEEGLRDGSGLYPWVLLRHLLPIRQGLFALYMPLAALTLAGVGLLVLFRTREREDAGGKTSAGDKTDGGIDLGGAFLIVSVYTVLTSPHFAWYFAWAIPFLCFIPSWPILYLTGSSTLLYIAGWPPSLAGGSIFYGPFLALLAIDFALRALRRHEIHRKDTRHDHAVAAETLG